MKLSAQWDCRLGEEYATQHLSKLDRPATSWFKLGRKHRVASWLERGLQSLFEVKLGKLTDEDFHRLGMDAMPIFIRKRDKLNYERRQIASVLVPIEENPSGGCVSHLTCIQGWHGVWVNKVSREIINPVNPLPFELIGVRMETETKTVMNQVCRIEALARLKAMPVIQFEKKIFREAVNELCALYGIS